MKIARFFRYLISGGTSCLVNLAILAFCVEVLHLFPVISSIAGFTVGAAVNYLMHYYWTFESNGHHHIIAGRFIIVILSMTAFNTFFFWVFFDQLRLWYLFSQIAALGIVVPLSYTVNKKWTFA